MQLNIPDRARMGRGSNFHPTRRFNFVLPPWGVLLLGILLLLPGASCSAATPNLIFILTDDQGYGDMGVLFQNRRSPSLRSFATPALDRMAAEGMLLRHHYTGAPVCAPARASLLLGQHQGHCPIRDNQFDKALPDNHTLATVLKQAGYHTACIGKWGLQGSAASNFPGHPLRHGFDEFFGFLPHNAGHTYYHDASKPLQENFTDVTADYLDIYSTDLFTARAKKLIAGHVSTNASTPFFLYLAYTAIHNPLHVPGEAYPAGAGQHGGLQWPLAPTPATRNTHLHPDYANAAGWTDNMKRYATMMRRLDDGVGDLLQLLRDLNLHTNTLVVFSSDNGPANENGADPRNFDSWGPFDGFKRDCWEGGVRVPTVAWWPGRVPTNAVCDFPSGFWDWMPTFAEAAGLVPPAHTDGVSLLPSLLRTGTQRNRGFVYVEYFVNSNNSASGDVYARKGVTGRGQQQLLRVGDWVGIRTQIASHADPLRLYNVVADPHQDTNLAGDPAHAPLLARMKDMLLTVRRPEPSAARPYDGENLPPVSIGGITNGVLNFQAFAGGWPWVPDFAALTSVATGQVAGLDLSIRPRETNFGVAFQGYLEVPVDGAYTFYLTTDRGAHLWIHDAHVIDDDFGHDGTERSGTIRLCGGLHPIRLFYRHSDGERILDLQYSGPGLARQPVPASAFHAPGGVPGQPTAFHDAAATTRNTAIAIDVLANDVDDGQPGPLSILDVTPPTAGLAVPNRGKIVYTPNAGFLGADTFTYTATDGELTATATVRVNVYFQDGMLWFPFNQTEGLTTTDAGGGTTATLLGFEQDPGQWVGGKYNRALEFDGANDQVQVTGHQGILGASPRTLAAWLRTTNSGGIASWGQRASGAKWIFRIESSASFTGALRVEVEGGYIIGTTDLRDGQWHHVACTFANDGSPNVDDVRLYVDGRLEAVSSSQAQAINTQAGADVQLGTDVQSRYLKGTIDEFRLYDRALSAEEIAILADARRQSAEAWHYRHLGDAAVDWDADTDHDGLERMLEYALGGNPHVPENSLRNLSAELRDNRLRIRFPRRTAGTHDLDYEIGVSTDLEDWTTLTATEVSTRAWPGAPGFEEVIVQADAPVNQMTQLFVRLHVGWQ